MHEFASKMTEMIIVRDIQRRDENWDDQVLSLVPTTQLEILDHT